MREIITNGKAKTNTKGDMETNETDAQATYTSIHEISDKKRASTHCEINENTRTIIKRHGRNDKRASTYCEIDDNER